MSKTRDTEKQYYTCNPFLNTPCTKEQCHIFKGDCNSTSNPAYSTPSPVDYLQDEPLIKEWREQFGKHPHSDDGLIKEWREQFAMKKP